MAYPHLAEPVRSKIINASISGLGQDVFYKQAPTGTTRPYVVFYEAVYMAENDNPRKTLTASVTIESVGATEESAYNIHSAISDALDGATLSITGWSVFWLVFEGQQYFVDTIEGTQYHRWLGEYRIRADKN